MLVERNYQGNVAVLRPDGKLTYELSPTYLVKDIEDEIANGYTQIVINLLLSPYMDSFGLGILVRGLKAAKKNGAVLKLCSVSERNRNLFEMANLGQLFESFPTEKEAIQSFEAS